MKTMFLLASLIVIWPAFAQEAPRKITLSEAIRLAQQKSPILGSARLDSDAAQAGVRVAKAGLLPQLSANGFLTSGNNAGIYGSPPMAEPPAWMLAPTGTFLDGNLSLMAPLLAPRLQAMASSATWQSKASTGELAEAQADLAYQVTEAYERVLLSRQMILAEEAKVAATRELVRTSQALFESGKGIEASVQRTQAELARAERALTSARNEESKAILDLSVVIGEDLSAPLEPSDDLKIADLALKLEDFVSQAKTSRGMLIAARARREAAGSDIRAAEGQRLPQLYGAVMGDATSRRDMGGLTAGLTLSFPLFDGGRISAEVSQARSMKAKAEANLRLAELTVEKEVREAWLDVQTAQANAHSAESSVTAAQSAYDVTALRVSAGKSILVEQLDALEALIRAKSDLAQATFDQVVAVAKLNRAAGARR